MSLIVNGDYRKHKSVSGVKATGTFILVEKLTLDECANTSIVLPHGQEATNSNQAYVVDIGPAFENAKWGIAVGDRVLLQGSFVPVPTKSSTGRDLAIVSPHDIKAVLVETQE